MNAPASFVTIEITEYAGQRLLLQRRYVKGEFKIQNYYIGK